MKPASVIVKYRTVTISVFPWSPRPGVRYWKFHHGKKTVVRSTLEKARDEAKRIAEETYLGNARLGNLTEPQIRGIRRMLEADPALRMADEFATWAAKRTPKHPCKDAVAEFLALKAANAGTSPHHVRSLTRHLSGLPAMILADIGPADLPQLTGAPRSRKNRLDAWKAFFRWCVTRGYLPAGDTVADAIETKRIIRATPSTWSPDELAILLAGVQAEYLPWLALAAWAGIRTEEICPDKKSGKSPLQWSDFKWDRGLIEIRPETSKTGHRRIVPIQPCLAALLPQDRVGRVGPHLPPHKPRRSRVEAETTRLGKLVGGWRRNALRHSFISYRAAVVGIAQAAMEAGNSESVSRKAYQDAKGADEAAKWFTLPDLRKARDTRLIPASGQ